MLAALALTLLAQCGPQGPIYSCPSETGTVAEGAILGAPVALADQCTGAALDSTIGAVTVTRAGSAYCPKSDGTVVSIAADKPRVIRMGLLVEDAATELLTAPRDLTDAAWTKANMTAALTAIGADSVANSATTLTATANNGTAKQTVTLAGGTTRAFSISIRRRTGTGTVLVSYDDFATSCDVTDGLAAGMANGCTYIRVSQDNDTFRDETVEACTSRTLGAVAECAVLSQSGANPVLGIKLATSGDAIDVDFTQLEESNFASTPMLGSSRAADDVRMVTTTWPTTTGAFEVRYSPYGMPSDFGPEVRYLVDTRQSATAGGDGIVMFLNGTNGKLITQNNGGVGFTQDAHFTTNDFLTPYGKPRLWRMEWDATSLRLRVNGVLRGTTATPDVPTTHSGDRIGSRYDTAKFGRGVFSNIAVSATALDTTSRAVALHGDSIAEGKYQIRIGDNMFLPMAQQRRWVTSFAVSGARVDTIANSCSVLYVAHVQGANFTDVPIYCGVNNILTGGDDGATAEARLETLLNMVISDGKRPIAMTLMPCLGYTTCLPTARDEIEVFNGLLRTWAAAHTATAGFIDMSLAFRDPANHASLKPNCLTSPTGDGLHLNDTCNVEFANTIEAALP